MLFLALFNSIDFLAPGQASYDRLVLALLIFDRQRSFIAERQAEKTYLAK